MEHLWKYYKPCLKLSVSLLLFTLISFAFFSSKMIGGPKPRVCVKKTEAEQQEDDQTFFDTYDNEIVYRNEIAEKICKTYPEFMKIEKDYQSLFWQNSSHLAYCYHPKAGSSTWLKILFSLAKEEFISEAQAKHVAEDLFVKEEKESDFKNALLLNVLQDPFSRLIEGYLEKLKDKSSGSLKEKILMVRKFVEDTDRWKKLLSHEGFNIEKDPTPEEYLIYVITQLEICESETSPEGCWAQIPSLWKPYHMECSPCAFKYDIISKIETFDNDLKYIRNKVWKLLEKEQKNSSVTETEVEFVLSALNDAKEEEKERKRRASNYDFAFEVSKLLMEHDKQRFRKAYRFDYLLFDYNPFEFE